MLMWEVTIAQEVTHFMGYQIFMSKPANYEEGNIGGALIRLDSVTQCHAFYFHGAMMATPIYLRQIQHIQQVTCVAPFQTDCELSSQTGTMYYGKAMDGTYFVEKQFSKEQQGLPSGILLFMIPPDYYEEVLLRLISLPNLPLELLNQNCDGFEAHHTLPQKHRSEFEAQGINIDEPGNVVWRKKENHRKQTYQHTKAWDKEYEDLPNKSKDDVYKLRDQIENEIFENLGDTPLE